MGAVKANSVRVANEAAVAAYDPVLDEVRDVTQEDVDRLLFDRYRQLVEVVENFRGDVKRRCSLEPIK